MIYMNAIVTYESLIKIPQNMAQAYLTWDYKLKSDILGRFTSVLDLKFV